MKFCLICFPSLWDYPSSDSACTGCSPVPSTAGLYILSSFYNYFGRKFNLIRAISLWPEPEAACCFHLLSPFSKALKWAAEVSFGKQLT